MTDSEIIDSVDPQKEVEQQDDDSEEEEDFSTERITWADVPKGRYTLVNFSERQKAYSTQEVMQLHLIQEYFMRKRQETMQHPTSGIDSRKPLEFGNMMNPMSLRK